MASDQTLWIPPLSPKDQQRLNRQRKRYQKNIADTWLGFQGKTVWDVLHLLAVLAIPIAVALGTAWFGASQSQSSLRASEQQHQTDLQIAADQQQEASLQIYLDRMSDLLLNHHLKISKPGDVIRNVVRSRTLTLLPQINGTRKREVVQFLYWSGLLQGDPDPIVLLDNADLIGAYLSRANLFGADLRGAVLSGANLFGANLNFADLNFADLRGAVLSGAGLRRANLQGANLQGANLRGADLIGAYLLGADLRGADLRGADLRGAEMIGAEMIGANLGGVDLSGANLSGAIMPNGSKYP